MDPDRWYWTTVLHEETGRPINVFVQASSTRAVVYSHRRGRWTVDPAMVNRVSWDAEVEGSGRLRATDRAGAEEAARQFGQTLPSDDELSRLLGTDPVD